MFYAFLLEKRQYLSVLTGFGALKFPYNYLIIYILATILKILDEKEAATVFHPHFVLNWSCIQFFLMS